MAAVTYWVDGNAGNDGNGGASFGDAFATMSKALTEVNGGTNGDDYTINVADTTTYTMDAFPTQVDGHGSSTLVIQGVDSGGSASLTSVTAPSTGACGFAYPRTISTTEVKGFDVDFLASTASASIQGFIQSRDSDSGRITVEDCRFRGSALGGSLPAGSRRVIHQQAGSYPNDYATVQYCVMENMKNPTLAVSGASLDSASVNNCVFIVDADTTNGSLVTFPNLANASNDNRFFNNTVYIDSGTQTTSAVMDYGASAGDQGRFDLYSNVLWYNSTHAAPMPSGFIGGGTGGSFSSGTIGSNVYYTGPDITSVEAGSSYESAPWSAPYSGDVEDYEIADTTLFADPSTTYAWAGSGGGYTLTVGKDLRLILETTSGLGGSLPGALPAAATDYTATLSSSVASPEVDESVTMVAGMSNSGSNATGVTATMTGLTGMTFVSATPTAGSYDDSTGIWTIGALNTGASESMTLVYTVDSDQAGNTITPTFTWTSGAPSTGGDTSDDTDSITLSVVDTDDPENPEGTGVVPFLDVLPIFTRDLTLALNMRMSSKKNRLRRHYLRADIEDRRWREFSTKRITLATNTSMQVNLGGIERGDFLFMQSTTLINIAVGNSTNLYVPAKVLVLSDGDFEQVWIQNTSTTLTADVWIGAVD